MSAKTVQCNTCGASWTKPEVGAVFVPHVCPTEVIDQHSEHDPITGVMVKPATFKPLANRRDENLKQHPERKGEVVMASEGLGVTENE